MKNKARKFARDNMLPKFTAEDMFEMLFEERKIVEKKRTEENIDIINERFRDLSAVLGKELTGDEESAILDIVDEYTPKDKDGNYLYPLLPFDYAWKIYRIKDT
jgi:hypothetical protein